MPVGLFDEYDPVFGTLEAESLQLVDSGGDEVLNGLTPYEYICKVWTSEPDRIIVDPIHQMPGLHT